MEIPAIDKTKFKEVAPHVFILNDNKIDKSTQIYKYIDLLALGEIVTKKIYRVCQRKKFSDLRERGELSNPFIEGMMTCGKSITEEDKKRWKEYQEIRRLSGNLYASCFTLEKNELHAMWTAFTTGYTGVRIATTIGDFIENIDTEGYEVYIGNSIYSSIDRGLPNFERYIFAKNKCYEIEKELRMYFIPKDGADYNEEEITLNVKNSKFISEILLSPFIRRDMKVFMLQSLKKALSDVDNIADCITHSHILENGRK